MVPFFRMNLFALAVFVLAPALLVAVDKEDGQSSPPSLLVILQGYLANRDAFPFVSSQFKIMETEAASVEAGLRGEYNAPQIVHLGLWYRNGKKERLRVSCNEAVAKKIRAHEENSVPIVLEDYLSDGKYQIKGGSVVGIANFYGPGRRTRMNPVTPFNFYSGDFDRYLTSVLANPKEGKVNGFSIWRGHRLVSATLKDYSVTEHYGFDPAQGWLPLTQKDEGGASATDYNHIVKVRKVDGNRWFPEKWVSIQHLRGAKEEFRVRTLEVTSLDVTTPPPDSAFDYDLSDYFQVLDRDRPSSVYSPSKGERITVGNMKVIADKLDVQVDERSRPTPEGEPPQRGIRPFWLVVALAVPLILLGLFLIIRFRRKKKPAQDNLGTTGSSAEGSAP